jgi:hypothetical protein
MPARAGTGINTIPARVINIRVVIHTRLTTCVIGRMQPTITWNTPKGLDVKTVKR